MQVNDAGHSPVRGRGLVRVATLAAVALLATTATAQVKIGVTVSATGPAASRAVEGSTMNADPRVMDILVGL